MFIPLFIIFVILLVITIIFFYIHDFYRRTTLKTNNKPLDSIDSSHQPNLHAETKSSDVPDATVKILPKSSPISPQALIAENVVEHALRQLKENRYFVFRDLIIPSIAKSMTLTQIDHVVVSRKGIFCIETKSNNGNIYGRSRDENWKQYIGKNSKPYLLHSPFRQNYHHVKSLEMLLGEKIKAPVHSYIAFPNARKVIVDGVIEDMSLVGVVEKIQKHQRDIYDYESVEVIAKILAHTGTLREQLRHRHINEVKAFLDAKVMESFKSS